MDERFKPVLVGVVSGILLAVLPDAAGVVVVVAAALLAGWVLPTMPVAAAVLYLLPTIVVGAVRVLLDGDADLGAFGFGLLTTVVFVAILTHVGAGLALRRRGDTRT